MRLFSLEEPLYRSMLEHQAVHMDQGVCYCPEYLAQRAMRYYPSRVAQVIRAVWLGELEATQYGADMVFSSVLSGQGERWQNFGEDPNGYLISQLLGRELFLQKGFYRGEAQALKAAIEANNGHIEAITPQARAQWETHLPTDSRSKICLLVDDATFAYTAHGASALGAWLSGRGIAVQPVSQPWFLGFEYLAAGLAQEGLAQLRRVLEDLQARGVERIITLSGQSAWLLKVFCPLLELEHSFEVNDILQLAEGLEGRRAYLYGGSFYTRYLRQGDRLNRLMPNTTEQRIPNTPEFTPLLAADHRVNHVGLWTAPLCPEFLPPRRDTDMLRTVYGLAEEQLSQGGAAEVVVCDPYAYACLRQQQYPAKRIRYFTTCLG